MSASTAQPVIVWVRRAFRLADNPLWQAARSFDAPIIPVFILNEDPDQDWPIGGAAKWWLHHSLKDLSASLHKLESNLILDKRRSVVKGLLDLAKVTNAQAIVYDKRPEPDERHLEVELAERAPKSVQLVDLWTNVLLEPGEVKTGSGEIYRVFTPFWKKALQQLDPARPFGPPQSLPAPDSWPESLELEALELLPTLSWDKGFYESWEVGEKQAQQQLESFLTHVNDYNDGRDLPAINGTSRLSPYLHWGQISPRQIWHAVYDQAKSAAGRKGTGAYTYLSELGWREFAQQLLVEYPETTTQPLFEKYKAFPWREDKAAFKQWSKGQTGYPIVDAGMRQLWATGWMHNRLRMVVASFLVKDLLIHWVEGARWFWDCLVDADLASNTLGWQWAAGCGADAAPYFRIFNPVRQGERFDKDAKFIKRWVPELTHLEAKYVQQPWEKTSGYLKLKGIELGETYPAPMVDHKEAKDRALKALEKVKNQ